MAGEPLLLCDSCTRLGLEGREAGKLAVESFCIGISLVVDGGNAPRVGYGLTSGTCM